MSPTKKFPTNNVERNTGERVEILEKRLRHGTKQEKKRRESDETLQFGSKEKR